MLELTGNWGETEVDYRLALDLAQVKAERLARAVYSAWDEGTKLPLEEAVQLAEEEKP